MHPDIIQYNQSCSEQEQRICDRLVQLIYQCLPEAKSKIWHKHPVWFLDDNPVVGYSKLKAGIRLFFWSGKSFDEPLLEPSKGKFQDASFLYTDVDQVIEADVVRWVQKSKDIQWDYKNIVKRKGELLRLK
jgi:hypothetical protein